MSATPPHARLALGVLTAALLALFTQGCVVHHHTHDRHVGPPPQAPAHGYYHHHDGVTLVFEKSLDSYLVEGHTHHYYYRNRYYRFFDNRWQMAVRIGGPWNVVAVASVPVSLRGRHKIVRHHRHDAYPHAAKEYRKDHKASTEQKREDRSKSAAANQSDW